jgi:hypothetical protein
MRYPTASSRLGINDGGFPIAHFGVHGKFEKQTTGSGLEVAARMSGGESRAVSSRCSGQHSREGNGVGSHLGDSLVRASARDSRSERLRPLGEGKIDGVAERFGAKCIDDVGIRLRITRARQESGLLSREKVR